MTQHTTDAEADDSNEPTAYEEEMTINHLTIEDRESPTIPVTLTVVDDEEIVLTPHDDAESEDIRLLVCETNDGAVRLHTHDGYNVNDERMTRRAYPRDDGQTIKLTWKHDGEHVKNIVLDAGLFGVIDDAIKTARDAQDQTTVSEAMDETGIDVPAIPLVVKETGIRTTGWDGKTTIHKLTVVPATDDDDDAWELWGEAVRESGELHTTHKSGHAYPPEGRGYDAGDELTLHDLIDEWHCIDAGDVISEVADLVGKQERKQELESLHESYPDLRGTDADPDETREAAERAAETGDRQYVARSIGNCNDSRKECNLDHINYYVTPSGDVETTRTHTH